MYKIIPHKILFLVVAWLVFGSVSLLTTLGDVLRAEWLRPGHGITLAWMLVSIVAIKPVWRYFWRICPKLNEWIFPDLNGTWEVEMHSNYSRQRQLIDAAAGRGKRIEIDKCPDCDLDALLPITLKAEIQQTWFRIDIKIWNPDKNTSIKRSGVISADPFRADGLRPSGLFYFFKQENASASLADDAEFYGSARIEYDGAADELSGIFWTPRMWERAINTAGRIIFRREAQRP